MTDNTSEREIPNLESVIAEAREMQKDGHYINGRIFHAYPVETPCH